MTDESAVSKHAFKLFLFLTDGASSFATPLNILCGFSALNMFGARELQRLLR